MKIEKLNIAYRTAQFLLQINAIKLNPQNPFTWASGIQSPIYCDNRTILSFPEIRTEIITQMSKLAQSFGEFDSISGVATAGIAHGALISDQLNLPFSYIRSKPKGHGMQNLIEGRLQKGDKVLVVEDLISTGGSSIKAVEAVRNAGCEVVGVIAIFSYEFEQAKANFEAAQCAYKTLSGYQTLIHVAEKENYISPSEVEQLLNWSVNPKKWGEKFGK